MSITAYFTLFYCSAVLQSMKIICCQNVHEDKEWKKLFYTLLDRNSASQIIDFLCMKRGIDPQHNSNILQMNSHYS